MKALTSTNFQFEGQKVFTTVKYAMFMTSTTTLS